MIVITVKKNIYTNNYFFCIKGKNGKVIARSQMYRRRSYCTRIINKITNTINWKIRYIKE